ncbi:MAG TPA: hypothetical protein ENJ87_00385 [Gammaproteobacteria bacterium]|nr:hypothetical protein [Gammaproteobacteria bacterium]
MAQLKKISSTLSIAATLLLEACGSSGGNTTPAPETNTKALSLIGNWQTACVLTSSGTSTTTGASGSGSVSGGTAFIADASFTREGRVILNTEFFSSSNCNTNTSSGTSRYEAVYFIGEAGVANDGSDITGIDFSDSKSTTFSIFQITNGFNLSLGDRLKSSAGKDGGSISTRYDGLGEKFTLKGTPVN